MPTGSDWIQFIYVNIGFISQVLVIYYFNALNDIKANWAQNRCNPIYLPLSDNIEQDFTYCIQSMQKNYMGFLLEPIHYLLSGISNLGGDLGESLNNARNMLGNLRSQITSVFQNLFGVFMNLIVEFQKITLSIKDLIGKIIGTMVALMYILEGSVDTANASWNGPPGQMIRGLQNACFHPETRVPLANKTIKMMKDLDLGDILENNSRVDAVMKIDNLKKEDFYKLPGDIYVTGSHMILDKSSNKYIPVKEFKDAIKQDEIKSEWFSCLITSNHLITIGEYVFWDWEDDVLHN